MARTSGSKNKTTTTSATVDKTMVADNSQDVVVEKADNVEMVAMEDANENQAVVSVIEETVKEAVTQLVKESEVLKPLEDTDDIIVKSLIPNVSYKDNKTMDTYNWKKAGDTEEVPFEVLKNMYRNHRGYFRNLWLKPLDERVVEKFKLDKLYNNYEKLIDIQNYNLENIKEMCEEIHNLPNSAKLSILTLLRDSVDKGDLQDIRMIKQLESSLKIDLISLV